MSKKNVTKASKTAVVAAQELLKAQSEKDIQDCIKELQESEAAILNKYGCVKGIQGRFVNSNISVQMIINKAR